MYRRRDGELEVFLIHMGGPFWANKDDASWSIPKGEFGDEEDALDAAKREFREETGFEPGTEHLSLTTIRQPGGKVVHAWAFEGDCDPEALKSNTYRVEWPPKSGQWKTYPEADRGAWFTLPEAREKILKGQLPLIEELQEKLTGKQGPFRF
jgi:predicted NUDIX family NTP pyrophosphohydrolase